MSIARRHHGSVSAVPPPTRRRREAMKHGILALVCSILLIPAVVSADNLMRDYIAAPPGNAVDLRFFRHRKSDNALKLQFI